MEIILVKVTVVILIDFLLCCVFVGMLTPVSYNIWVIVLPIFRLVSVLPSKIFLLYYVLISASLGVSTCEKEP